MKLKSTTAALAISLALVALLLAGGWFLLISPTNSKLAETSESKQNTVDFNDQNRIKLLSLQDANENLDETKAGEEELNNIFPPTAEQLNFFAALNEAARAAGIDPKNVTSLTPTAPIPVLEEPVADPAEMAELISEVPLAPQSVTMQVTADLTKIRALLANLENMERALFITSVQVSGEGASTSANITGYAFVAPPLLDPEEAAAMEEANAEDTEDEAPEESPEQ